MAAKDKKLCKWKKDEYRDNLDKLTGVVSGARFVCERCGRAAKAKKWLCKPVALPK